jgi:hypothetical protein
MLVVALRTLCNMFKGETGEKLCVKHREFILTSAMNCKTSENKNVSIALSTLLIHKGINISNYIYTYLLTLIVFSIVT